MFISKHIQLHLLVRNKQVQQNVYLFFTDCFLPLCSIWIFSFLSPVCNMTTTRRLYILFNVFWDSFVPRVLTKNICSFIEWCRFNLLFIWNVQKCAIFLTSSQFFPEICIINKLYDCMSIDFSEIRLHKYAYN